MAIVVFRPAGRLLAGVSIQHEKGAGQSRDGRSLRGGEEPEFYCSVGGGAAGLARRAFARMGRRRRAHWFRVY